MNKIIKFFKIIKDIILTLTMFALLFTIFIGFPIWGIYTLIHDFIYPPKQTLWVLEAKDMNPIKTPRSSKYQIESTGLQFFKVRLISSKGPAWYYILDSSGYCYGIHGKKSSENNTKLFSYLSRRRPHTDPHRIETDNFKLLYLRGTLQYSHYAGHSRVKETIEEQRKAMLPEYSPTKSEWECTKQMPGIDIIEIKYQYNNQIYHFKINDDLEKQFQNDLIYTFK